MSVVSQHGAGEDVKKPAPQDTQTRSRLIIGQNGPSDSALAASSGGRLLAAQPLTGTLRAALLGACARACVPRRYTPSNRQSARARPQSGRHLALSLRAPRHRRANLLPPTDGRADSAPAHLRRAQKIVLTRKPQPTPHSHL